MKRNFLKTSFLMAMMFAFVAVNAQNTSSSSTKAPATNGDRVVNGSMVSSNNYIPSSTMVLTFDLTASQTGAEYIDGLSMVFPAGMTPIITGSSDPFAPDNGCSNAPYGALNPIVGTTITWGTQTPSSCGWWNPGAGSTITISVGVTIGVISGPQTVTYNVMGDGYGSAPHSFSGNITVNQSTAHDMGVTAITPSTVYSGSTVTPTVTLKNHGSSAEATWTVVLSDGGSYTSTKTNLSTINAGASLVVNMDPWTPANGDYTLTATVSNVTGDANASNDVLTQACSVSADLWVAAAGTIPAPTYMGSSAGYFNGTNHYLYSFGGNTVSTLNTETSIYNIETETWTAGAPMPAASLVGCATTAGDYIYVLRGSDGASYTNTLYRYDIVNNTWSTLAPIPAATPIAWTRIATVGGNLYCVGGNDGTDPVNSVYRYNIAANTWTTATAMTVAHFGGSLAVVNGKLVYVMGIDAADDIVGTVYVGTIDGTNPDLITWTVGASTCPTPVFKHKASPWTGNKVIVTGGNDGFVGGYWGAIATSYTYDIGTDTWQTILDKTTPTIAYAAASFVMGTEIRYYVATGYNSAGSGQLSNVEYFTSDFIPTGINTVVVESPVSVYPNPTQGAFTVELGDNNSTVTVYNLMGEVISSIENVNGTVPFDLSNVASGIYLVKIVSDNKVIDRKVNVIH